jgi:hypothetical protein
MSQDSVEQVVHILQPFTRITRQLPSRLDTQLADYMFKLVRSDEMHRAFEANPIQQLRAQGIQAERVDVPMFKDLATHLRNRVSEAGPFAKVAETLSMSETTTHENTNFEHDTDTTHHTVVGETTKFETNGIPVAGDEFLRHELALLFYPAQPLVTPALVDQIRTQLGRSEASE